MAPFAAGDSALPHASRIFFGRFQRASPLLGRLLLVSLERPHLLGRELGVAVRVQTTRCQSECADGPNVKLLPEGRVLNGVRTTAEADEALERCATYAPE